MRKALLVPAVLLACTGFAMAQTETTQPQKKSDPAPTKANTPAKPKTDAAEPTLRVGDAAPAISVDQWIKGEPVTGFEKGKVYVVEFWATWCPPCVKSIPHLTELQKKHKDLTVIGVASSERKGNDGEDNRLNVLQTFVEKKGEEMNYTIAYDSDRQMAEPWLKAAAKNTIPTAFIVDREGKVAWIGNPLDKAFDAEIEKSLTGAASRKPKQPSTDSKTTPKKDPVKKEAPAKEDKKK